MTDGRFRIDSAVVRRTFSRAASGYDSVAVLQREVARRMAERLDLVNVSPRRILDAGCGTGADLGLLAGRYPDAQRIGFDPALPMLRVARSKASWLKRILPPLAARQPAFVCGDARRIPFKTGSAGLAWSNLVLHWLDNPFPALSEIHRVLEVDGLLMFSCLGPDTLQELRAAFAEADNAAHVNRFIDMHDLGDMLLACGFADPVMDMEKITLTYARPQAFLRDLRAGGSGNALEGRRRGLTGRRAWQRMLDALAAQLRDGQLAVTFEIVYGHAWKPQPRVIGDGRQIIRLDLPRKP